MKDLIDTNKRTKIVLSLPWLLVQKKWTLWLLVQLSFLLTQRRATLWRRKSFIKLQHLGKLSMFLAFKFWCLNSFVFLNIRQLPFRSLMGAVITYVLFWALTGATLTYVLMAIRGNGYNFQLILCICFFIFYSRCFSGITLVEKTVFATYQMLELITPPEHLKSNALVD